mmetsp:Transcript_11437/g.29531  ORF Transcript_11437/g.29531 Transcript_11437/m.29531 type:complete len:264 (+) Transcript_11437:105-896(+)
MPPARLRKNQSSPNSSASCASMAQARHASSKAPDRHLASWFKNRVCQCKGSTFCRGSNNKLNAVASAASRLVGARKLPRNRSRAMAVALNASPKSSNVAFGLRTQIALHSSWSLKTALENNSPNTSLAGGMLTSMPSKSHCEAANAATTRATFFRATACTGQGIERTGLIIGTELSPSRSTSIAEMLMQAAAKRYSATPLPEEVGGAASRSIRAVRSGYASARNTRFCKERRPPPRKSVRGSSDWKPNSFQRGSLPAGNSRAS